MKSLFLSGINRIDFFFFSVEYNVIISLFNTSDEVNGNRPTYTCGL